jgi:23S rRNA (uracil1939-C5)-methyltransferase
LRINTTFAKKMSRRKAKPFYKNVRIENIGSEGKALTRINGIVVFTPLVVPGDIVDLQVVKVRKNYQEAVATKIHEYSTDRANPFCRYFGTCGGCKWQNLPYEKQLYYKQKQVKDQLMRIGGLDLPEIRPIKSAEKITFYRNKLEFTFSNKKWLSSEEIKTGKKISNMNALGFHVPGMFDKVINIEKCWLQPSPSNEIRNFIYRYAMENQLEFFDIREQKGLLRTLIIKTSTRHETMVILSFFRDERQAITKLLEAVKNEFPAITSLMYVINSKGNDTITDLQIEPYSGRDYIFEEMGELKFKIGSKSFYQTNPEQAYYLYRTIIDFADFSGNETVYDLYSGTGTISNFIARKVNKVIGIEYIPDAVADARENSTINNTDNTLFFAGDIKDILNREFAYKYGQPDLIVTDPPRTGMHKDVVNSLLEIKPRKIIYVSCNPATQARDISLLGNNYNIYRIQPVDMFPHTHHVENVVLLESAH